MYVRRKVFSILQDENGEERLFSVNDVILNDDEEQREFGVKDRIDKAVSDAKELYNKAAGATSAKFAEGKEKVAELMRKAAAGSAKAARELADIVDRERYGGSDSFKNQTKRLIDRAKGKASRGLDRARNFFTLDDEKYALDRAQAALKDNNVYSNSGKKLAGAAAKLIGERNVKEAEAALAKGKKTRNIALGSAAGLAAAGAGLAAYKAVKKNKKKSKKEDED